MHHYCLTMLMIWTTKTRTRRPQIIFNTPKISFPTSNRATINIYILSESSLGSSVHANVLCSSDLGLDCWMWKSSSKGAKTPLSTRNSSYSSAHLQKSQPTGYITNEKKATINGERKEIGIKFDANQIESIGTLHRSHTELCIDRTWRWAETSWEHDNPSLSPSSNHGRSYSPFSSSNSGSKSP